MPEMICMNNASNESANSSSLSLSSASSPVRPSLAIKQLLESPLIRSQDMESLSSSQLSAQSDTDLDTNPELDAVMVEESPEPSPFSSQDNGLTVTAATETNDEMVTEVADSQVSIDSDNNTDDSNDSLINHLSSLTGGGGGDRQSCLRRQSSVCVSHTVSKTSSPRALAILKNAIKTSFNNNNNLSKNCDKIVTNQSSEDQLVTTSTLSATKNSLDLINGCQSPPNHKLIRNSPFSRGSAALKAAKERKERLESERSPKIMIAMSADSGYDRRLTGILRKHELQSSPTSSGEPKPKKKKVLFAEPVVSSKLEFKLPSPSPTSSSLDDPGVQPLNHMSLNTFHSSIDCGECLDHSLGTQEVNDKRRNHLVHQNSQFDKEFDANLVDSSEDDSSQNDLPILTQKLYTANDNDDRDMEPSCGQQHNPIVDQFDDMTADNTLRNSLISSTSLSTNDCQQDSQDSEDLFMCSQVMPESPGIVLVETGVQTIPMGQNPDTFVEDPVVNVPMRLSLVKELYNIFGNFMEQYSQS